MLVSLIKGTSVQEICEILFAEILILQDEIVQNKITELRDKSKLSPEKYFELSEEELLEGVLREVGAEVKSTTKHIASIHIDSILDAKNEKLITNTQMKTLLTIVNGLSEAIELEL